MQPRSRLLSVPTVPSLITTATLWHLATQIDGEVQDERENALSLAALLHQPCPERLPARPRAAADSAARTLDRQLFGGIVGWCDSEGNGEWVTIRCGTVNARACGCLPALASSPTRNRNQNGVKRV